MTEENVNPEETANETPAEPETTDAPEGVADVANVPEDAAPEIEEPPAEDSAADESAADEPVAEAPPVEEPAAEERAAESEAETEVGDEPPAEAETETDEAEAPADEPVAEAPADEPPLESAPEEQAEAEVEESPSDAVTVTPAAAEADAEAEAPSPAEADPEPAAEVAAPPEPKKKKKRLPRALRPQRTKTRPEKPAERKAITRLPKPEHARGPRQERQGTVVSAAADKTIVVRVDTVKAHRMYKKVIRRSTKLHAHDESNAAKIGDIVRIVETRPLSKMKRWRLQEIVEAAK